MRRAATLSEEWIFPAGTKSSHIEKSTLKKQHPKACTIAKLAPFPLYTLRHTCLTRWAAYMDPYTLAYLAGHSDFSTTRRYASPAGTDSTGCDGASAGGPGWAQFWAQFRSSAREVKTANRRIAMKTGRIVGRGEWIRTTDLLVPNLISSVAQVLEK
jgi:hypothetical protein